MPRAAAWPAARDLALPQAAVCAAPWATLPRLPPAPPLPRPHTPTASGSWDGRPPGCGDDFTGACAPPPGPCYTWNWVCDNNMVWATWTIGALFLVRWAAACRREGGPCEPGRLGGTPQLSLARRSHAAPSLPLPVPPASVVAFLCVVYLAYHQLKARPYHAFRVENLSLRLGLRVRVPV